MFSSSAVEIDLYNPSDFLTDDQSFPTLKLNGEGVFTNLKRLTLHCTHLMSEGQSVCIASHLENLSVDQIPFTLLNLTTYFTPNKITSKMKVDCKIIRTLVLTIYSCRKVTLDTF